MTLAAHEIISWKFQKNRIFHCHFADGLNIAPHTPSYKTLFLAKFVMYICVDRNSTDNVCGLKSTLRTKDIISWKFQKNYIFDFHFADDPNIGLADK